MPVRGRVSQWLWRATLNASVASATRATAARLVKAVVAEGQSLSRAAPTLLASLSEERDRAFAQTCVYGVLRHYDALSAELEPLLRRPLRTKDFDLRALLLSALYQIRHLETPPHAAVSAAVEATRVLGKPWAGGLVNAVLRGALRRTCHAEPADDAQNAYEHPVWLLERIRQDWPDDWSRIVAANNTQAPLTLRINTTRIARDAYLELLANASLAARPGRVAPSAVSLDHAVPVEQLPGFAAGLVSVQDEAAQLAASLLDVQPGDHVLDACAAPGGKTGHLLEQLSGSGRVVAVERDARRSADIAANLSRLGLHGELIIGDAAHTDSWWDGAPFDRILLDAPCSACGVIRRHPDIRFHRRLDDIATLVAAQRRLLEHLWPLLRVGGRLLYATCSYLRAENDGVVATLVETVPDAIMEHLDYGWGHATLYGRQVLPGDYGMDGFYYALLRKDAPQ